MKKFGKSETIFFFLLIFLEWYLIFTHDMSVNWRTGGIVCLTITKVILVLKKTNTKKIIQLN